MTIKLSSIKNNIDREREGDFVDIPEWTGVSLKVRSTEYPPYKIALDQLVQRFVRKYKNKPVPPEERDGEVGKLVADHILLDWAGFDEPYSADFARDLLASPQGRELGKHALWASGVVGQVQIEFVEDAVKNSVTPSATN